MYVKEHDIARGDTVTFEAQGHTVSGEVLSAEHWGENDGWYIELVSSTRGYCYWKQGYDGGRIVAVITAVPQK